MIGLRKGKNLSWRTNRYIPKTRNQGVKMLRIGKEGFIQVLTPLLDYIVYTKCLPRALIKMFFRYAAAQKDNYLKIY